MKRKRQTGMAVVLAMLIVAISTAAATLMLVRQDGWLRQIENLALRAQADELARACIDFTAHELTSRWTQIDSAEARTLVASAAQSIQLQGAELRVDIAEPEGRYNLNNLVQGDRASAPDVRAFGEMLKLAQLPPELAHAVVDAIDSDSEPTLPGGAEDLDMLASRPASRVGNRPLLDPRHLVRIRGFTSESVERLLPFVTALPEPTPINVNSTPAEGLAALFPGLALEEARKLVAGRAEEPFTDVADLKRRLPESVPAPRAPISFGSRYYMVTCRARVGRTEGTQQALIGGPGAAHAGILWRRTGEL